MVAPYKALEDDLVSRAHSKGVVARKWDPAFGDGSAVTGLVFVSANKASSSRLIGWAKCQLEVHKTLRMLIIEEAHVPLVSSHYRAALARLNSLRAIGVPLMLLSGTVPPAIVPALQSFYDCTTLHVIREPSDRPNLKYKVSADIDISPCNDVTHSGTIMRAYSKPPLMCPQGLKLNAATASEGFPAGFDSELTRLFLGSLTWPTGGTAHETRGRRGIIYCLTKAECERMQCFVLQLLASHLQIDDPLPHVLLHHADLDEPQRMANVETFTRGTAVPVIAIATSCFGTGIDARGVSFTVCYGGAYSILDMQQALGRAGREGDPATCLVVWHEAHERLLAQEAAKGGGGPAVQDRATTAAGTLGFFQAVQDRLCLRQHLATLLDGTQTHSCVGTGVELCSSCEELTCPNVPTFSPQHSPIMRSTAMSPALPLQASDPLFESGGYGNTFGASNSFLDTVDASTHHRSQSRVSFSAEQTGKL